MNTILKSCLAASLVFGVGISLAACEDVQSKKPVEKQVQQTAKDQVQQSVRDIEQKVEKTEDEIRAEINSKPMMPWFRRLREASVGKADLASLKLPAEGSLPEMLGVLEKRMAMRSNVTPSRTAKSAYFEMDRDYAFALLISYFDEGLVAQHNLRVDFVAEEDGTVKPFAAGEYWKCRDLVASSTRDSAEPCG